MWRWRKKFISEGSLKTYSPCCRNSVIQQPRDRRGRTEPPCVGADPAGMGRLGSTNPACVLILKMRRAFSASEHGWNVQVLVPRAAQDAPWSRATHSCASRCRSEFGEQGWVMAFHATLEIFS